MIRIQSNNSTIAKGSATAGYELNFLNIVWLILRTSAAEDAGSTALVVAKTVNYFAGDSIDNHVRAEIWDDGN